MFQFGKSYWAECGHFAALYFWLGVTQERSLVIERVRGQRYYTSRFEKPPKLSLSGPVCESANGCLERARGEGGVSLQAPSLRGQKYCNDKRSKFRSMYPLSDHSSTLFKNLL